MDTWDQGIFTPFVLRPCRRAVSISDDPSFMSPLLLEPLVQNIVEVDIGQYWACRGALRRAETALSQVSCFAQDAVAKCSANQSQKMWIFDPFSDILHHFIVIDFVEELFYVYIYNSALVCLLFDLSIKVGNSLVS